MNNEVISMSADTKATDANGKLYHASSTPLARPATARRWKRCWNS